MDIPEEVEDLDISDPGENENRKSQWRHGRRRANKEDMEEALQVEDEMLKQRHIQVMRVVKDKEDFEETKHEEEVASGRAADGTSRIRRDVFQVVRQRAERARKPRVERPVKRRRVSPASADSCSAEEMTSYAAEDDHSGLRELDTVHTIERIPSPPSGSRDSLFDDSPVVLCSPDLIARDEASNFPIDMIRTISVAKALAGVLKPHQIDGANFIWKNTFSDLAFTNPPSDIEQSIGGCILAHVSQCDRPLLTCVFSAILSSLTL